MCGLLLPLGRTLLSGPELSVRRQVGGLRQAMLSGTLRNGEIRTPVRCGRIVKWYSYCGKQWRCCTRQHPLSGPSLYSSWVGWAHSHTHTRSSCVLVSRLLPPPCPLFTFRHLTFLLNSEAGSHPLLLSLPDTACLLLPHPHPSPAYQMA